MTTRQAYGAGSISEVKSKRRGNERVWRLRVVVDGKQVQKTVKGTKAAARRTLKQWHPEPVAPTRGVRTFGDLLDKWLSFQESQGRSPKTLDEAAREIRLRIRPTLGDIPLAELTAEHLDDAYTKWRRGGLSKSSVHRHAAVVSSALSQGVRWGWLNARDNPAMAASPPAQPKSDKREITPEELQLLIRAAETHEGMFDGRTMAAVIALGFVTGARRGELCALRWSDIDLEAGIITIDKSLSEVGRTLIEKPTKTDSVNRIPLDPPSLGVLLRHSAWQQTLSAAADSPLVEDPYVFSDNANGARPIAPSKVTDRFAKIRRAAGIHRPGVSFHSLRHAMASELLSRGVPAPDVAARGGWSSTRVLLSTYAHALPAGGVAAANAMGALLPSPSEEPE